MKAKPVTLFVSSAYAARRCCHARSSARVAGSTPGAVCRPPNWTSDRGSEAVKRRLVPAAALSRACRAPEPTGGREARQTDASPVGGRVPGVSARGRCMLCSMQCLYGFMRVLVMCLSCACAEVGVLCLPKCIGANVSTEYMCDNGSMNLYHSVTRCVHVTCVVL